MDRIGPYLALVAIFWFMFTIMTGLTPRGIARRVRAARAQSDLKPPRFQMHLPWAYGWYFVEFTNLGQTTGLCTFGYAVGHAANWEECRVRRHPDAPWWSWFRRPHGDEFYGQVSA